MFGCVVIIIILLFTQLNFDTNYIIAPHKTSQEHYLHMNETIITVLAAVEVHTIAIIIII